jgi:hypothetical protein
LLLFHVKVLILRSWSRVSAIVACRYRSGGKRKKKPFCITIVEESWVMKKTFLFLMAVSLLTASSNSFAALLFKMTSNKTSLLVGETATIEVFAYSEDAAGLNGLNSWQLSMLVSGDDAVQVVGGSISLFAPFGFDSLMSSVNSPNGAIKNLAMNSLTTPVDSTLGVGDYQKIMDFDIQGISVGQVDYSIGDAGLGFFGILRDYNPANPATWVNYFDGTFNAAASDTHFRVVPEPATLVLLGSGMAFYLLRSRKNGRV